MQGLYFSPYDGLRPWRKNRVVCGILPHQLNKIICMRLSGRAIRAPAQALFYAVLGRRASTFYERFAVPRHKLKVSYERSAFQKTRIFYRAFP